MNQLNSKYYQSPSALSLLYGGAVALVTSIYSLLVFNRFMPITEGWFSVYGHLILEGKVPYRDFYLFLPPAYPVLIAGFTAIFGPKIVVLRFAGVLLSTVFSIGLFLVIECGFPSWIAAVAAIGISFYYQNGNAYISYDFVQVMNTCVIWSTYCVIRFARQGTSKRDWLSLGGWPFLAGILCSWAAMTKHSNGSIITVFVWIAVMVAGKIRSPCAAGSGVAAFMLGCAAIVGGFALWLWIEGAIPDFFRQVIGGAIASKGSLGVILFQFAKDFFGPVLLAQVKWLARFFWVPLLWAVCIRYFPQLKASREDKIPVLRVAVVIFLGILAVLLPWYIPSQEFRAVPANWANIINYFIPVAVLGPIVIILIFATALLLKSERPGTITIPLIVSVGMAWGNGTSAGFSSTGVFLGLAIVVSYLLSHARWFFPVSLLTIGILFLQSIVWAENKYTLPYSWWGVSQGDVRQELESFNEPILRGLRASKGTTEVFAKITSAIQANSTSRDKVLIFPHTPIFYLICDRQQMGKAVVEWFDFLPDDLAAEESKSLLSETPELIVWLDMPEAVWSTHERLFRGGRPCGQRKIRASLNQLVETNKVVEIDRIEVQPGFTFVIYQKPPTFRNAGAK